MFSLLSSTFGILRPSILKPQTWRLFSSCHVNFEARKLKQDEINKLRRLRYATDPQYREQRTAESQAWTTRKKQDPGYLEARNDRLRLRYKCDDEYRKRMLEAFRKSLSRLQAENARFRLRKKLYYWCVTHHWVRETLPWKTHEPVLFAGKVHKECKGCTRVHVRDGIKLWWREIGADESWLCHACHMPVDDHTAAMPHGYEDVTTFKELVTRKEELARLAKT